LGSTSLLSGECFLYKNGAFAGTSKSVLLHDQDLGFFKIVTAGNIFMSFDSHQVTSSQVSVTGAIVKRYHVSVWFKFPNGDEYVATFGAPSQGAATTAKAWIDNLVQIGQANMEVKRLLKVKERVPMVEVGQILARHSLSNSAAESAKMVEGLIATGVVDGVLEGDTFVSRLAKQRETVNYQVVTSFDVAKDGVISLKCPSCGSPVRMLDPSPNRKCDYCGAGFMVPKRILDML
jgi:hypothetical protein